MKRVKEQIKIKTSNLILVIKNNAAILFLPLCIIAIAVGVEYVFRNCDITIKEIDPKTFENISIGVFSSIIVFGLFGGTTMSYLSNNAQEMFGLTKNEITFEVIRLTKIKLFKWVNLSLALKANFLLMVSSIFFYIYKDFTRWQR